MSPRAHIQWSRHVHKAGATLLATVLAVAMILLPQSLPTHAQGQTTTIDSGTVNLFKLRANAEGASWTTLEHTSTSGETTEHNHKDVLIRVPATTHTDQLPQDLPITSGYTVHPDGDLTLGWDVSAIQSAKYDSAFVKLETSGPTGARVVVHSMDDNGTVTPVLKNGATELEGVTRFDITQMNRVNTVWTFSHPGTYTIDFRLGAERIGASLFTSSASGTITFHVGEGEPSTTGLVPLGTSTDGASPNEGGTTGDTGDSSGGTDEEDEGDEDEDTGSGTGGSGSADGGTNNPADNFTGDTPSLSAPEEHQKDPVTGRDMLYRTHVDAAHIYWDKDSQGLAIGVIDGSTLRPADDVVVRLGPDADDQGNEVSRIKVPTGSKFSFLGEAGTILWNAPAQFYRGWRPVWAGYGAGFMPSSLLQDSLRLDLVGVDGPGDMIVWRSGGSFVAEDFNSAKEDKRTVSMVPGGHGHINWSFTKEGRYTTKWRARATTTSGATLTSDVYEVVWLVGEDEKVDLPEGTTIGATIANPVDGEDSQDPGSTPDNGSTSDDEEDQDRQEANAPAPGSYVCAAPGHYDLSARSASGSDLQLFLKDESGASVVERPSYSVVVPVADTASAPLEPTGTRAPLSLLGKAGTRVWTLPEVQDKSLPWLGLNTQGVEYTKVNAEGVRVTIDDSTGPGRVVQWDSGTISPARILLDSDNWELQIRFTEGTHRHVATSFNAPGLYLVSHAFKAIYTPESNLGRVYKSYNTYFAVGNESIEKLCPGYLAEHGLAGDLPGGDNPGLGAGSGTGSGTTPGPGTGSGTTPGAGTGSGSGDEGGTGGAGTGIGDSNAGGCLPAGVTTVLDSGHVDLFYVSSEADGSVDLSVMEDVTGTRVRRTAESVLIRVKESAKQNLAKGAVPEGLEGEAYLLPQAQDQERGLVWPGWDTMAARNAGFEKAAFDVTYSGPKGGAISMWISKALGGFESRIDGGGYTLRPEGSTIVQDYAAHTHVNWAFSAPGRYTLKVKARMSSADGTTTATTPERTYVIDVATVTCPTLKVSAGAVAQGDTIELSASNLTPGSTAVFRVQPEGITLDPITVGFTGVATTTWAVPAGFKVGEHHVTLDGFDHLAATFKVTAAATPNAPGGTPAGGQGDQKLVNTAGGGAARTGGGATKVTNETCYPTTITREATAEEAEKLANGGAAGDANTATTVLTFNVGGAGNADDGHFDLGPGIENNTVVARIKDDRNQPASWVDPSTLTFGLGEAAKLTAPEALSFVATPGSTVWMIPSTQIAGVPWLGMNSQREEIVNGTRGGVTFTLDAVDGPGKVAVFTAGALGSGVGDHVFTGAGSSYVLPANTHAHQNWVFTEPGTYKLTISMKVKPTGEDLAGSGVGSTGLTPTGEKGPNGRPMVSEVVGRTKSGEPCDLASTGSNTADLVLLVTVLAFAGAGALVVRRRRLA